MLWSTPGTPEKPAQASPVGAATAWADKRPTTAAVTIVGMALALSRWTAGAARLARPFTPLIDAVRLWLEADGLRMSAAMTFYGLLSLSPLVLLVVGLLGWWMDRSVVESTLLEQVHGVMGERGASVVQAAMTSAQRPAEGRLASLVAMKTLLAESASGVSLSMKNTRVPPADSWNWPGAMRSMSERCS